ncbi:MAG: PEP-CTERM sorting domain-containing protein, partial [Planctomycetota bacterium]
SILTFSVAMLFVLNSYAHAQTTFVIGGDTTVLLDTDTLSSAASLDFSGVSDDVGTTPEGAAIFGINGRGAASLPTTFSYTPSSLAPFAGTIEHTGSVFFNNDTVEVGNFTIGFDNDRVSATNSGFFVESTTGIGAILFDVAANPSVTAEVSSLAIDSDLLVSNEFATFLTDNSLATQDLTGADVGDASIRGISAVPEPSSALLISLLGLGFVRRRKS